MLAQGRGYRCGSAKRGYIAIAPEIPHIAVRPLYATGDTGYLRDCFKDTLNPLECNLYESIRSVLDSFMILESGKMLPENIATDKANIGVTGLSWGGYMTIMASAVLKDRVRAAFSIFGTEVRVAEKDSQKE